MWGKFMSKKIVAVFLVGCLVIVSIGMASAYKNKTKNLETSNVTDAASSDYGIQWQISYGSSGWSGARYEGPQPIGDSDNDGQNEFLIGGRDSMLRVMKWNENTKTYVQTRTLHCPFYPILRADAGGFAIGDITNDGKNEIAATWYSAIYKYFAGRYWTIGWYPSIFNNGGGSSDCYIGDCNNDGKNELIVSGGPSRPLSTVPEIVVLKWSGSRLVKIAEWDDTGSGYVYMPALGDVDNDGQNEIVCACSGKVVVLKWNEENSVFDSTVIINIPHGQDTPFGCVCKDCDGDGNAEILVSYYYPHITIFKWNGSGYATQFDVTWPGGDPVIEGIDAGDTDDDGIPEVVAGAGVTHILQWNGITYVEEATLPTYGWMAVISIGDCDNDGKNEINAGNVDVDNGQDFMSWVFKYGWEGSSNGNN